MPRSTTPLWLLTFGLLIVSPTLNAFYWGTVLGSGLLPHDGDSIGIPIFAGLLFTLTVAPFVIFVTWYCLRRYNPESRLFAWRSDRPVRSLLATVVFGGAAGMLIVALVLYVADMFRDYPWREFIFVALLPPAVAWSLAMRSALNEQSEPPAMPRRESPAPWGPNEQRT